ncbi:MAG: DUF4139 domain-containing protein [Rhodocyclaceae bacterium]|nr:DUF4139 domain-containing protein [Rhodocyclaceae bacterium]
MTTLQRIARISLIPLSTLLAGIAHAQSAKEIVSTSGEREATAITVYNDDLALVKERRKIALPSGLARLSLREVSAKMRPETALLRAVSGSPISLIEQNFDFDLLTPQKLLEKYVGEEVRVLRMHPTTGEERSEKATVLSSNNGTVLRFADRIETGIPGRLAFDSVPANLRDRPTLSVLLDAAGGSQSLELSYLTGGLAWKADFVANLSSDGKHMDLSGWVTLTNRSGAAYDNAKLQLVAGTVNRVRQQPAMMDMAVMAAPARAKRAEVAQESLMDYHLYSFERPTSIADNQTKQLALLSASSIPVSREYLLAGNDYYYRERYGQIGQKLKPAVFVEFANKGGELGKPLPAGVVRVYAKDSQGAAQFVGEDKIEHTAKNETVKLKLGEAFDITAERKQTNYKRIADNVIESSYRIELRNARDETVTVRVQEPLPGDWEMIQESHKHSKESARVAAWPITVPAGGSSVLDYTVRVRW